jgi:trans-2,3-dihydro-3-hydroxyanthranilate isomerase
MGHRFVTAEAAAVPPMGHRFVTADVFTDRLFGGNPLAVFPEASGIDPGLMQSIAAEFNLSETVFVLPPDDPAHARRLRIFTPALELPFAGHPTVGAAFVLAALGEVPLSGGETDIVFEEGVGPVPVRIRAEDGRPVFTQLTTAVLPERGAPPDGRPVFTQLTTAVLPERGAPPPTRDILATALSLEPGDLVEGADRAEAWSAGVPFLCIPVTGLDALARARPDLSLWDTALAQGDSQYVYLFTRETGAADSDIRARMFAPAMNITEDPATGAAAAAFTGYLAARDVTADGTVAWVIEQGVEMGRPSRLHVEADKQAGALSAVRVGGSSVLISEGIFKLPG